MQAFWDFGGNILSACVVGQVLLTQWMCPCATPLCALVLKLLVAALKDRSVLSHSVHTNSVLATSSDALCY